MNATQPPTPAPVAVPEGAVERVLALHAAVEVEPSATICAGCSVKRGAGESVRYFPAIEWPCETVLTVRETLTHPKPAAVAGGDVYADIRAERERAHAKHGEKSMEAAAPDDMKRLRILAEEVGEVAREFNEADIHDRPVDLVALREELIQTAAMAAAWADACAASPEPVVAPLPAEAVEALARIIATAIGCGGENAPGADECDPDPSDYHAAEAVLAAGYRLVPEDDEDTVRVPADSLTAMLTRQREWSRETFGPGPRTAGVLAHIRSELDEVEAAPGDVEEWVDVVILALDGAWRAGHEPEQIVDALLAKYAKNRARTWPDWRTADPDGPIEHVR